MLGCCLANFFYLVFRRKNAAILWPDCSLTPRGSEESWFILTYIALSAYLNSITVRGLCLCVSFMSRVPRYLLIQRRLFCTLKFLSCIFSNGSFLCVLVSIFAPWISLWHPYLSKSVSLNWVFMPNESCKQQLYRLLYSFLLFCCNNGSR